MPSPPKRDFPKDQLPFVTVSGTRGSGSSASTTYSGGYAGYLDYYSVISGSGLTPATRTGGQRARPTPTPTPTPAPSPPVVAPPPDLPPPIDAAPTLEPPVDEIPSVSVEAPRVPVDQSAGMVEGSLPFATLGPSTQPVRTKPVRRPVRRSRPAPRRTPRRIRPGPGPRIPIPVPDLIPVVRVVARATVPIAILSLVPPLLSVLGRVDRYGTEHMLHRMFPPIPRKRREREPSPHQRPGSADPDAVRNLRPDVAGTAAPDMPTVVVEGTRPSPMAPPATLPLAPFSDAGYIYPPEVRSFAPAPSRRPARRPAIRPSFDPLGKPARAPYPLPVPPPFPLSPGARPAPRPAPAPSAPGGGATPGPIFAAPGPIGTPSLDPVPDIGPVPLEDLCAEARARKKPKKKRSPRTECWKGTYIEKSSGISKMRRVRVDCVTGLEINK